MMKKYSCRALVFLGFIFALAFLAGEASAAVGKQRSRSRSLPPGKLWRQVPEGSVALRGKRLIQPQKYLTYRVNRWGLNRLLAQAPREFTNDARSRQVVLELPYPDGRIMRFRIEESPIMAPELAAKFPEIKTYRGQGVDDLNATVRFDLTPAGFHAQVISAQETVYIDPYSEGDSRNYISYFKRDFWKNSNFECLVGKTDGGGGVGIAEAHMTVPANGATLRNYRLALAATGEYTVAAGGTVPLAFARMTTSLARVNGIYERELAVRMTLVPGNMALIFTDPVTDPYTNSDGFAMLAQNQATLDSVIGNGSYDMGHVFSTGGGGIARIRSTCLSADKGQGVTGLPSPVGDPFDVDFVAHEMGHQHGGLHTFNTSGGGCGAFRTTISAFEPAGGSTPMSYVGTCPTANLQRNADDYFHVRSLEEIVAHMTVAGNCAPQTATGNLPPTVDAGPSFSIPRNTPFTLTASGSDGNGDPLTYAWEEYDLGPVSPPESDADGSARPIFRSYSPVPSPSRTFPSLTYILSNANVPPPTFDCGLADPCITGESLPNITRTMAFQVTARDNRGTGGGIVSAQMMVSVTAAAGPFIVTAPNTSVIWGGGSPGTVTWDVAGTTAAPVSAATVNIRLSTDGGTTFPIILAAGTANDGTEVITTPNLATTTARIKVEAVGNIFFDIGNANFSIAAISNTPFDFDGDAKSDLSVFRPSSAVWYLARSTAGFSALQFGLADDKLAPADYDGDGKTDIAVWRESTGLFYILNSSTGTFRAEQFGQPGDILTVGDWDGDAKADLSVYRDGPQSYFYYRGSLSNPMGSVSYLPWGIAGDKPMLGDFDGDAKQDTAVFRPSDGIWYILQSSDSMVRHEYWGLSTDKFVPVDYDGDGKSDLAVFRSGVWYIRQSSDGLPRYEIFGLASDAAVPADYDGDGKADIAVFRSGIWYTKQSSNGVSVVSSFGLAGDSAVPNAYVGP